MITVFRRKPKKDEIEVITIVGEVIPPPAFGYIEQDDS
jgi:hypothetical protein